SRAVYSNMLISTSLFAAAGGIESWENGVSHSPAGTEGSCHPLYLPPWAALKSWENGVSLLFYRSGHLKHAVLDAERVCQQFFSLVRSRHHILPEYVDGIKHMGQGFHTSSVKLIQFVDIIKHASHVRL